MEKKPWQPGFFISEDGTQFHRGAHDGDEMIRPKKKRVVKHRRKSLTPFQEVMALNRAIRTRTKILEEYGMWESLDGDLYILKGNKQTWVGEERQAEFMKELQMQRPEFPQIPVLSDTAQRLKFLLEKRQRERYEKRSTRS